jgi:hypothetical protein
MVLAHDVAVRARRRIIREVGRAAGVDERKPAQPGSYAGQYEDRCNQPELSSTVAQSHPYTRSSIGL